MSEGGPKGPRPDEIRRSRFPQYEQNNHNTRDGVRPSFETPLTPETLVEKLRQQAIERGDEVSAEESFQSDLRGLIAQSLQQRAVILQNENNMIQSSPTESAEMYNANAKTEPHRVRNINRKKGKRSR